MVKKIKYYLIVKFEGKDIKRKELSKHQYMQISGKIKVGEIR